jgi:hypothetical protein
MRETCSLDVAAAGAHTLEQVGDLLNITRERVSQIEEEAIKKLNGTLAEDVRPGSITHASEYVESPIDDTLQALGLSTESDPWLKTNWLRGMTCDDKP